jgi:medium-chain acyl-[acyl-carrier-protein] hydrolase
VSVFRGWADLLPAGVEVCAVELPGRDTLIKEPPLTSWPVLVRGVREVLTPHLDGPFVLFGHSLGALLAFELARALRTEGALRPRALVVSGHAAPHVRSRTKAIHHLPGPEFLEGLRALRGTPPEVLDNRELMELLTPALRADFFLDYSYRYSEGEPLAVPIRVFGGGEDTEVNPLQLSAWRRHGSAAFGLHMFPGGHFFLHTARPAVLAELAEVVSRAGTEEGHADRVRR